MEAEAFNLLAPSHIIFAAFCIAVSVYLPRFFIGSSEKTITIARYALNDLNKNEDSSCVKIHGAIAKKIKSDKPR